MTTLPNAPLAWVRKISDFLPDAAQIPLFGNAPPFDWQRLSTALSQRLEMKDFSIQAKEQQWKTTLQEIKTGLGASPYVVQLYLNPIASPLYFAMSRADMNKFSAWMMNKKARSQISEPLKEGFCRFLMLEVLEAACKIGPLQKLTPQLSVESSLPEESSFCMDLEITSSDHSFWGRLILPSSFRREWVEHFSHEASEYVPSPASKQIELICNLRTGRVALSQKEWKELEKGDFLLLDQGSYDLRKQTGISTLCIGDISLFQVKIKQNKLELLDYAFTNEDHMEQNSQAEGELQPAEEESGSIKNIPLNVTVELARLKITLDRLMHLNPGNMLELPISPDQGVSLCVNGKKVGRAELVYLGESLGIRILEIG